MEKISIYGAGKRGASLIRLMEEFQWPIGHVIDNNSSLWGKKIGNCQIEPPQALLEEPGCRLCITLGDTSAVVAVRDMLKQCYQFDPGREVSYYKLIMDLYDSVDLKTLTDMAETAVRDRITVLFDCEAGLGLGGIEEWTKGICGKFLEEGDYDAFILTDNGDYQIPEELQGHLIRADIDGGHMFSLYNMKQMLSCIGKYLPCILVTSQPDQTLLAGKILRELSGGKVKVISGIRGGFAEINKSYVQMRNCTDLYVCVNSAIRQDMIQRGVSPDHIYTMLCPVECPASLERNYSLKPDMPLQIGYAGRLEEDKRMDLMPALIEQLEERGIHYTLEFAGEGSYQEQISAFAAERGCSHRIKLPGKIDRQLIPAFWQKKDICLNISDQEGRSRSTIEAMANGAVPIVTDTWGVRDDIVDGENGFIVQTGDYKAMAEKICFLDRNRERLLSMGRAAHEELRQKCSMEEHYRFWQKMTELVMRENRDR